MSWLETLMSPSEWPKSFRRSFILTIPISGPIWAILVVLCLGSGIIFLVVFIVILMPASWLHKMWTGYEPAWMTGIEKKENG